MKEKSVLIHKDILFVAMTRSPTILGVPYVAFVLETMAGSLIIILFKNPLYMTALLPFHAVLYAVGSHDPGIFAEIEVWTRTIGRCLNRRFWGGASFSPLTTKKWERK